MGDEEIAQEIDDEDDQVDSGVTSKSLDNSNLHFKHQFADATANFYCQAFFAKEFRDMRYELHSSGEEGEAAFIHSLSRCVKWDPQAGKSRSEFFKMQDGRLIMKQLSKAEASSVVSFAPHYIAYIHEACRSKKPTVLAKILGIFRIGFKNSVTGRAFRQDVIISENLFFNHKKITRIFDLKGSMRSRYAQATGHTGDVLLDENLLEFLIKSPIYIRAHSKYLLESAIRNDTNFLTHNKVMDYSLLVCIDEVNKELVVGIIDYIRTFTWDKKLEMYVKSSGILGGAGNRPTVISPRNYKVRFSEAIATYFVMVPDRWSSLSVLSDSLSFTTQQPGIYVRPVIKETAVLEEKFKAAVPASFYG